MSSSGAKKNRTMLGVGAPRPLGRRAVEPQDDPAPSEYEAWVGRVIDDRYEIESVLAEGGMGAVFVAKHLKLGKPVAVKVMHPSLEGNEEVVQRFAREVEVTARLSHRHVVTALDCGKMEDGSVYLALELVGGRSLAEAIHDDGPFEWRRAAAIGAQIADALSAAHREGIVHRDLKPDNIVIEDDDGDEIVKVLDFGIAHVAPRDGESAPSEPLTRLGVVLGTVGYMAPEQCLGQPVDARADLYTLGVLLWEMLAGRSLYDDGLTLTSFVTRQLADPPRPIREVVDDVPEALAAVLDRLLVGKKEERAEDARAIRDALRALSWGAAPEVAQKPPSEHAPEADGGDAARTLSDDASVADASPPAAAAAGPVRSKRREPRAGKASVSLAGVGTRLTDMLGVAADAARLLPLPARIGLAAGAALLVLAPIVVLAWPSDDEEAGAVKSERAPAIVAAAEEEVAEGAVPSPIDLALATILHPESDWRARREAALTLVRHEPADAVPPLALSLARLETSPDCRVRTTAVRRLGELGDARAIEPLRRHRRARRPRCGRRFQGEVDRAVARIRRASQSEAAAAE